MFVKKIKQLIPKYFKSSFYIATNYNIISIFRDQISIQKETFLSVMLRFFSIRLFCVTSVLWSKVSKTRVDDQQNYSKTDLIEKSLEMFLRKYYSTMKINDH